jgi:hypothetical protein
VSRRTTSSCIRIIPQQELFMKILDLGATVVVAGLLIAAPALAQSTSPGPAQTTPTAQKQKADGADNPSNPREYDGAAEWHKQHIQSQSHSDGSPAGVTTQK